jgi:hypothetical protein
MSRHVLRTAFVITLLSSVGYAPLAGQGRGQTPAPAASAQTPAPAAKPGPAPTRTPPPADAPPGQPVNIKLDLTITDQIGPGEPSKKTVGMIVADRASGSIRSTANSVRATLNVDATPQILPSGTIKVLLALEYNPQRGDGPPTGSSFNQRVSIVLVPGRALQLSQAADPLSDRKITVEIRADILK